MARRHRSGSRLAGAARFLLRFGCRGRELGRGQLVVAIRIRRFEFFHRGNRPFFEIEQIVAVLVELAKRLRGVILSKTNKILSPTEFSAMQ